MYIEIKFKGKFIIIKLLLLLLLCKVCFNFIVAKDQNKRRVSTYKRSPNVVGEFWNIAMSYILPSSWMICISVCAITGFFQAYNDIASALQNRRKSRSFSSTWDRRRASWRGRASSMLPLLNRSHRWSRTMSQARRSRAPKQRRRWREWTSIRSP